MQRRSEEAVKSGGLTQSHRALFSLKYARREVSTASRRLQETTQSSQVADGDHTLGRICKSHITLQEANADIELFLKQYFLHSTGQPDLEKTPQAITLHGLTSSTGNTLYDSAEGYLRRLVMNSGDVRPERIYIVGCEKNEVWRKARSFDAEIERRRAREAFSKSTARMDKLEQYVIKDKDSNLGLGLPMETLAIGRYIVESHNLQGLGKRRHVSQDPRIREFTSSGRLLQAWRYQRHNAPRTRRRNPSP